MNNRKQHDGFEELVSIIESQLSRYKEQVKEAEEEGFDHSNTDIAISTLERVIVQIQYIKDLMKSNVP